MRLRRFIVERAYQLRVGAGFQVCGDADEDLGWENRKDIFPTPTDTARTRSKALRGWRRVANAPGCTTGARPAAPARTTWGLGASTNPGAGRSPAFCAGAGVPLHTANPSSDPP